jgi:membrane-bound metal-dependent hydrolase YbcI (DUF457 family)
MTGSQHVRIGVAASVPAGVALATGAAPGLVALTPPWLLALGGVVVGAATVLMVIGGGLVGSLAPDLDTDRSTLESAPLRLLRRLRRWRPWFIWLPAAPVLLLLGGLLSAVNWLLMRVTGHRGATHSLLALAVVTAAGLAATAWGVGPALAIGLGLGYASHLAADALTPAGIEFAAPLSRQRFYLLPRPLRFGGESWRAGCLTHLALIAGLAAAGWMLWRLVRGG